MLPNQTNMSSHSSQTSSLAGDAARPAFVHDVAVIGGGIIGVALARELTLAYRLSGYRNTGAAPWPRVLLLEKEADVMSAASGNNSAILHCGFDAYPDTLEFKLIKRGYTRMVRLFNTLLAQGMGRSSASPPFPMRRQGALVVAWTEEQEEQLELLLTRAHGNNVMNVSIIDAQELYRLEPNLAPGAKGALRVPDEWTTDSWLVGIFFLHQALRAGADVCTNAEVKSCRMVPLSSLSSPNCSAEAASASRGAPPAVVSAATGSTAPSGSNASGPGAAAAAPRVWEVNLADGRRFYSRFVINAAGTHADLVEAARVPRSEPLHFTAVPRKGQFVVYEALPSEGTEYEASTFYENPGRVRTVETPLLNSIIYPVPTSRTKGLLIWPTVYNQIVVGPTATDQMDRDVAVVDAHVREFLIAKATELVPTLEESFVFAGEYAGLRPATDNRDYIIEADRANNWITCASIRSTGFTACLGVAEYCRKLLSRMDARWRTGVLNYRLEAAEPWINSPFRWDPRPVVGFDGSTVIAGRQHIVTHAQSRLGLQDQSPVAMPIISKL